MAYAHEPVYLRREATAVYLRQIIANINTAGGRCINRLNRECSILCNLRMEVAVGCSVSSTDVHVRSCGQGKDAKTVHGVAWLQVSIMIRCSMHVMAHLP